ncbi:porin [Photobacterium profundum]|uniref:Porin domain-containing protein n=1 Tax=Photobacterium profundum (strain SS9) TaxID=298386 RepID=Q6LQ89_PHOPR|nr:porin [Photobacterium profundum]CAG20537.1 hypothetical protein PBPRA2139 [Photobacterium profundum SS9]
MNKKIIALAVAAAVVSTATSVSAATVYQDGASKVTIGGRLAVRAEYTESVNDQDSTTKLENNSSRINFGFEHEMVPGWIAGAKAEWGYDALASGSQDFSNRLGNVYFLNEQVGTITLGKQWSTYYDITAWTDVFWIYGGEASGTYDGRAETDGHGDSGTGRANEALSYRQSINGLNIGVQYQFEGDDIKTGASTTHREYGLQSALSYDFDFGISLGGAYSLTKYEGQADDKTWSLGALYQSDMLYVAGQYGQYENHTSVNGNLKNVTNKAGVSGVAENATGYEFIAAYLVSGGEYQVYGGYNGLEDDDTKAEYSYGLIGAAWTPGSMIFSAEYKLGVTDKDNLGNDSGADQFAVLARYNF